MVRGKGTETLNAQLEGKQYKDGVNDIIKYTVVRPSDLDQKVFTLLDALAQRDRSQEACAHLKQALEGITRDRISNWRAYVYTLLRGFDEAAYASMKAEKGDGRRRRSDRPEKEGREGKEPKEEKRERRRDRDGPAATAAPKSKDKAADDAKETTSTFNAKAAEFVPATAEKKFSATASEFVPGKVWPGAVQAAVAAATAASKAPPPSNLHHTAAPFVPGRQVWAGEAPVGAAGRQAFAPAAAAAAEFVPGRPWQANGEAPTPEGGRRQGGPVVTLDARLWPEQGTTRPDKTPQGKNAGASASTPQREKKAKTPKAKNGGTPAQPEVPGPVGRTAAAQAATSAAEPKAAAKAAPKSAAGGAAPEPAVAKPPEAAADTVAASSKGGWSRNAVIVGVVATAAAAVSLVALARRRGR